MSEKILSQPEHLSPLPDECRVFRLVRPPMDFLEKRSVSAIQLRNEFNLSTEDKKSAPPHLSVWDDSFTTANQAYSFLGENSPRRLVLGLKVKEIREIIGNLGEDSYPGLLDVIWVHIFQNIDGEIVRDKRLGADGHSGIIGLDEESVPKELTANQKKTLRKDLRSKLAEIASKDCFLIDCNSDSEGHD